MAKMRRTNGRKPGAGWSELGTVDDGQRWFVFIRPDPESEWVSVKVVADGRALGKANFWTGWNGTRFSRQADVATLALRPVLMAAVRDLLVVSGAAEGADLL